MSHRSHDGGAMPRCLLNSRRTRVTVDAAWAMGQQRRFTPPMPPVGGTPRSFGPQMAGGPEAMVPIDPRSELLAPPAPLRDADYSGYGGDETRQPIPTTTRDGTQYVDLHNVPQGERFQVGTGPGLGWVTRQRQRDGLPPLVVEGNGDGTGTLVRRPMYHPPGSPENPYTADQLAKQQQGRDARADKKDRMLANRQNYYGVKPKDSLVPEAGSKKTQLADGKDKQGRQVAPATPVSQSFHIPTEGPIQGIGEHSDTFRAVSHAMTGANGDKKKFWNSMQAQGVDRPTALKFAQWMEQNPQPIWGISGALTDKALKDEINGTAAQMRSAFDAYFDPPELDQIRSKKPNQIYSPDIANSGSDIPLYGFGP